MGGSRQNGLHVQGASTHLVKKQIEISGDFARDFLGYARAQIVALAVLNVVPASLIVIFVHSVTSEFDLDLFQASATLLALITAAITFFASQPEDKMSKAFRMKKTLIDAGASIEGIAVVFLRSIFMEYVLWWGLVGSGVALALSSLPLLYSTIPAAGVASLAFLSSTAITIVYWMTALIFTETPGDQSYRALVSGTRKSDQPTKTAQVVPP